MKGLSSGLLQINPHISSLYAQPDGKIRLQSEANEHSQQIVIQRLLCAGESGAAGGAPRTRPAPCLGWQWLLSRGWRGRPAKWSPGELPDRESACTPWGRSPQIGSHLSCWAGQELKESSPHVAQLPSFLPTEPNRATEVLPVVALAQTTQPPG